MSFPSANLEVKIVLPISFLESLWKAPFGPTARPRRRLRGKRQRQQRGQTHQANAPTAAPTVRQGARLP